jgi:uncharacterized Zn finger protein
MNLDEDTIRDRCTEAVFDRGQNYRQEGRIKRRNRVGNVVTAVVRGTRAYDVTIAGLESTLDPRCTCPYDGPGDCKHVVAILLTLVDDPPADEAERLDTLLDDISTDDLRAFVLDTVTRRPALRDQFFARFGGPTGKSVNEYRTEVDDLFDEHTEDYPVVVGAIDFSRFFDLAEQYRENGHYQMAATVYRALFEGIDDNIELVDGASDHYARNFQDALDGYVECVTAAELSSEAIESSLAVLDERASSGADVHRERFADALSRLEEE